jgi:threonine dehydrogenase-like Zn-dependent dehydrogenase
VVLRRPKVLELVEVPVSRLTRPEHVLIRVMACGVCGSDLRYWAGDNPWALHTLGHHVDNPPNIILGHEYAGVVAGVNSPEYEHLLGRRVGVQAYRACGECRFCQSGRHNLCKQTIHMGHGQGWGKMDFYPGAYAEYCLGWGDLLYPIPDGVSHEEAAMADIFCVGVHVAGRASIPPNATALCIGGGPAGLSVAQVLRAKGAGRILVAEPSPIAREILARFDFDVFDPGLESLRDAVARVTGRSAVAAIFDSVGSDETISQAIPLLEECGTYVNLAVHTTSVKLDMAALGSEKTITTSSNAFYRDVQEAYELIFSRRVDAARMISHTLPLAEYQQAFDLLLSTPKQAYKVVFTP